jgi:hypothetical protein
MIPPIVSESADEFVARKDREWGAKRDRPLRFKDVGRAGWQVWYREAWTLRQQSNYSYKVLVIERLRRGEFIGERRYPHNAEVGEIEYRFGYYTLGAIGLTAGTWRWGQYAQLIPHFDFIALLADARADGTILDQGDPWHR